MFLFAGCIKLTFHFSDWFRCCSETLEHVVMRSSPGGLLAENEINVKTPTLNTSHNQTLARASKVKLFSIHAIAFKLKKKTLSDWV